jgi:cell division septation protein DedD
MASAARPAPAAPVAAAAPPVVEKPTVSREPASSGPERKPAAKPAASATNADGSGAFAVQVAALNTRGEADAIAKRLSSKGYAAYVQVPSGTASVFRVRVGSYKTRREAEAVATKLQKEERVKPWVTR